jgi:cytochrome d ubiquinol oxidase subunit II
VALMLVGLILRGVAFDFRVKAQAVAQAAVELRLLRRLGPGRAVAGLDARALHHRPCSEGANYTLFAAAIACCCRRPTCCSARRWLIMKTEGELQRHARSSGPSRLGAGGRRHAADLAGHALVSETVRASGSCMPGFIALLPIPLMTGRAAGAVRGCSTRARARASVLAALHAAVAVFVLGASGWPTASIPTW